MALVVAADHARVTDICGCIWFGIYGVAFGFIEDPAVIDGAEDEIVDEKGEAEDVDVDEDEEAKGVCWELWPYREDELWGEKKRVRPAQS